MMSISQGETTRCCFLTYDDVVIQMLRQEVYFQRMLFIEFFRVTNYSSALSQSVQDLQAYDASSPNRILQKKIATTLLKNA